VLDVNVAGESHRFCRRDSRTAGRPYPFCQRLRGQEGSTTLGGPALLQKPFFGEELEAALIACVRSKSLAISAVCERSEAATAPESPQRLTGLR